MFVGRRSADDHFFYMLRTRIHLTDRLWNVACKPLVWSLDFRNETYVVLRWQFVEPGILQLEPGVYLCGRDHDEADETELRGGRRLVGFWATGRTFCSTLGTIFGLPGDMEATRKKTAFIHRRAADSFARGMRPSIQNRFPLHGI